VNGWEYNGDAWRYCDRPSHYDDDSNEQVCSKCSAAFSWADDQESVS